MKLKTLLVFALLISLLSITACAQSAGGTSVAVSCDDFSAQPNVTKQISVVTGNSFTVTLCSNATTGYRWSEAAQISDPAVVQQLSHETVAPKDTGLVGAPGTEVWTFKALKKGTGTIKMGYSRPWEGGEKDTWTFMLNVTVN
jgi:inhibitor of cysteine peptidase